MKLHEWQEKQKTVKGGEIVSFSYYDKDGKVKKNLFDKMAEEEARSLIKASEIERAEEEKRKNNLKEAKKILENIQYTASSQIRKYYDEVRRYKIKIEQSKEKIQEFDKLLPYIKMLRAKVMYAKGRKVVTDEFVHFINKNLSLLNSKEDLQKFLIFSRYFEAVLGFMKFYEEYKDQLLQTVKRALKRAKKHG